MQTQNISFETKDFGKTTKSKYPIVALIITASCTLGLFVLFLIEITPRYITFPISPPKDSYGANWNATTKSVWTAQSMSTNRVFIWRQDAILSYENTDGIPSWDSIARYFNENFSRLGWEQSDSSISCNTYLPEAAFLQFGENGFVSYRKTSNQSNSDETAADDVICLAIWNDEGYSNVYRIVLLTAKSSLFTHLLTVFEL